MVARYSRHAAGVFALPYRALLHPMALWRMACWIRQRNIHLVHTFLYTGDVAGWLAARLAGGPRVISHVVGHNFSATGERGLRRLRHQWYARCYRLIYRGADRVVAVCDAVAEDLTRRAGVRVAPEKIRVLRHSVMPEDLAVSPETLSDVQAQLGWPPSSVIIAVIASLLLGKGHRYLLQAMACLAQRVPSLRCAIIGDGPERAALEALAVRLGVADRVTFTGPLEESRKNAVIHLSRAIILPSLGEGLPVSILEAMALGIPVIATDVGGTRELVDDGVTGFVVPPGDPGALAAAMAQLASDEPLARRLGSAGQARLRAEFSPEDATARLVALYTEVLPPAQGGRAP